METREINCPEYGIVIKEETTGNGHWVAEFLSGYKGTEITVPEEVGGLKIVGLRFVNFRTEIRKIHISKTVEFISFDFVQLGTRRLDIKIDAENPYLKSDGKAVYTKDDVLVRFFAGEVTEYEVLDGTRVIGELAFWGASKLRKIALPSGLVKIGMRAFLRLPELAEINLPDTLRYLGKKAFSGCESLEKLRLPRSLEAVGDRAFSELPKFREITVDAQNPYFTVQDGILYTKDRSILLCVLRGALGETFEVPRNVRTIGAHAFPCNDELKRLILPPSVSTIEHSAFERCYGLAAANLENVRYIDDKAFKYCTRLNITELNCKELGDFVFQSRVETLVIGGLKRLGEDSLPECEELIVYDDINFSLMKDILSNSFLVCHYVTLCSRETGELLYKLNTLLPYQTSDLDNVAGFFKENGFDAAGYDLYWEKRLADEDGFIELKTYTAYFRIKYPRGLTDRARKVYSDFLTLHADEFLYQVFATKTRELLPEFFELGVINARNAAKLAAISTEFRDPEFTAYLLELKNKYIPNPLEDLKLD